MPREGVGCRGGTSATAGRCATLYAVTLPDGRAVERRSFKASDDRAVAHCCRVGGVWYLTDIHPATSGVSHAIPGCQTAAVPARRVAAGR